MYAAHMSKQEATDTGSKRALMVAAARQFYLEDISKSKIATTLGISRFKVARILAEARETGVVKITIDARGLPDLQLAQRVQDLLELQHVTVIETLGSTEEARGSVGKAAARHLGKTLEAGEVVGMAWGRTLRDMSAALPPLPEVDVVQLTGAIGTDLEMSPVEITRRVALNSGGTATPIFAPLVVDTPETADGLRRQTDVGKAFRLFDSVTTAVVSVGSIEPPTSQLWTSLDRAEQKRFKDAGAVAEVTSSLLDSQGEIIDQDFERRLIAISAQQLRRVPRVLAVAAGVEKSQAIISVARGNLCTEIVIDRDLAEGVLEILDPSESQQGDGTQFE